MYLVRGGLSNKPFETEFIEWFEMEIYGELIPKDEEVAIRPELNMKR